MTEISLADLAPGGHTSFSFYDFMPGQGWRVAGAPPADAAFEIADRLLQQDLLLEDEAELDRLAAVLLTHGTTLPTDERFERLAQATARAFAALLGNEAQRPLRMRLARLSLMLRLILDRDADRSGVQSETIVPCKSPWDLWPSRRDASDTWVASCDEDNLRALRGSAVRWSRRAGLPTQLDGLSDGLWVGSHYSNGGHIVRHLGAAEPEVAGVVHPVPLVLAFDLGTERWTLDASGALWLVQGGTVGRKLLQLPGSVHRARVIGRTLYAFDWSRPGQCTRLDLDRLRTEPMATGGIIICNDLCGSGGFLYGICKLQGRVFKMTADGAPLGSRLGAGNGPGELLDPIMIRSDAGLLSVLNWFSAKLVLLETF